MLNPVSKSGFNFLKSYEFRLQWIPSKYFVTRNNFKSPHRLDGNIGIIAKRRTLAEFVFNIWCNVMTEPVNKFNSEKDRMFRDFFPCMIKKNDTASVNALGRLLVDMVVDSITQENYEEVS
jgi:hypothetical protein